MNPNVSIHKLNTQREETWRYDGTVLGKLEDRILLEAFFNREDLPFHGLVFRKNDRFLELYFNNRWFNIFEIHDRCDDHLKGWYCNVTMPAEFSDESIRYVDLALDLLVFPEGQKLVLDEDEFTELDLDRGVRRSARSALQELQEIFLEPHNFCLEDFWQQEIGRSA